MSLSCPKCNHKGLSVAAMNYKESQEIDKEGRFQGGGVGIGTGGLGGMVGGGTYSEKDEIYSKRAKEFAPPLVHFEPIVNHFFMAILILLIFVLFPPVMRYLINSDTDSIFTFPFLFMSNPIAKIMFPIMGIIGFIVFCRRALKDAEEDERLQKEENPKILARYREIFYCENCHLLFDGKNNVKDGSRIGFEAMMQIPADPESLKLLQG